MKRPAKVRSRWAVAVTAAALTTVLAACGGGSGGTAGGGSSATTTSAASTTTPTTSSGASAVKPAVKVASTALGNVLTDPSGRTLYMFDPDKQGASTCYAKCAQAWPPLTATGTPGAGAGADASLLGTTKRREGTTQVTYGRWPLYYFAPDTKPGDVKGQAVGGVWWVVSADGQVVRDVPKGMIATTKSKKYGEILADAKGRTVYMFDPDKKGASTCYGKCAAAWPPVTTAAKPIAGVGVDESLFGTVKRKDGTTQVTYAKWPLYYFTPDKQVGDVKGQAVKKVWWVLDAKGTPIHKQ
jgi:predicted lipoprotein with Yx(FWY)xxD motif